MTAHIEPQPAPPRLLEPGRRGLTVGITLGISIVGFENLGVSTAMPVATRELDGLSLYGWVFSALMLGHLMGIVLASGDADEHGPWRAYVAAFTLFSAGLIGGSAAPTMETLVASRFVAGMGAGALLLLNWAMIGRAYPEVIRSKMLAVSSSAWVVPGLVGPAVAGWVADHLSWRLVFGGLVPPLLVVAALLLPGARRLGPPEHSVAEPTGDRFWDTGRRPQIIAALAVTVGAAIALAGLDSKGITTLVGLCVLGAAVASFGVPVLFPRGTWRAARGLPAVVSTYALLLAAFTGIEAFLPLALGELRGLSATVSGLILTGGTSSWAVGSMLQARDPQRWARPSQRAAATLLMTAGLAVTLSLTVNGLPSAIGYAGWAASALGMGLSFASISEATFRMVAEDRVGRASGATQLAGALSGALAAGIGGSVLAAVHRGQHAPAVGFRLVFLMMVGVGFLAVAAGRRVPAGSASERT